MTKETAQQIFDFIEGPTDDLARYIALWDEQANDIRLPKAERSALQTQIASAGARLRRMKSWLDELQIIINEGNENAKAEATGN